MSSVPQFIDVEDKIVGPLTWKQLGWMIGMGAVLLTLFSFVDTTLFIIAGIPVVLLFLVFAFYRPNGFPFTTFVFYTILFLFRPKIAVWKRTVEQQSPVVPKETKPEIVPPQKRIDREKLVALARILDGQEGK